MWGRGMAGHVTRHRKQTHRMVTDDQLSCSTFRTGFQPLPPIEVEAEGSAVAFRRFDHVLRYMV